MPSARCMGVCCFLLVFIGTGCLHTFWGRMSILETFLFLFVGRQSLTDSGIVYTCNFNDI
ncbi:hypothetical protein BDV30DRAFT_67086 [Aspergillus minisclerotigenes]|uniref:Uncharacterized protein n=1 Tax=Aspergillus minisclerotigenes TaxID=656917 RepID=A0A5N6IJM4_9EURO|nr:hypothetical protein BDV30DRAFT_67086 [Aspergillus minisclerotigenes]